jgi:hypothetical protein
MKRVDLDIINNIDKLSTFSQIGGIEVSVLENGHGRGTRIANFITGSGLNFKVILDRAMDISSAYYKEHSLTWISHKGITTNHDNSSSGWLGKFGGGLMTTCGLMHIGATEEDQYGKRELHDTISFIPAEIESVIQPNLYTQSLGMSISGKMTQSTVFGPSLELKRIISAELGKAKIRIHDTVRNIGNQPVPHMLLYHINLGWPLIDENTQLIWQGKWKWRDYNFEKINAQNDPKICIAPIDSHQGSGESVVFIDPESDENGLCNCEAYNTMLKFGLRITFKKDQLPWLCNWQHWGKNEYVIGLEPGTNPPIGQTAAREEGSLIWLQPREIRDYYLEIEIVH